MSKTESCELTVLCLLQKGNYYLLQDRIKADWKGFALPGGHVEPGESIVDACIREMKEETGLIVKNPRLCGIKHFPLGGTPADGRYLVFLFTAHEYEGELSSSTEGKMHWIHRADLPTLSTVPDFADLLTVMTNDQFHEFQYVIEDGNWTVQLH